MGKARRLTRRIGFRDIAQMTFVNENRLAPISNLLAEGGEG
jgi:hypothetical protein